MKLKTTPEDFVVREHTSELQFAPGPYNVYLLRKVNWNTEDCLQWLSEKLRIHRKDIGYCGNKDRHALTEQYITIKQGPKTIYTPDEWSLIYLGTRAEPLRLGQHERNFFIITVRDYSGKLPTFKPVKNLFGEQRFGDNTEVGLALLRKDYGKACELLKIEHGTDLIGALRKIPKHTLLLYVHAAQSKLWNELAVNLPSLQDDVPLPGFSREGKEEYLSVMETILANHNLSWDSFINRSFQELTLEGVNRKLLQDLQDFYAGQIEPGVIRVCFSLGKGQYATETVRQLLN